MKRNSRLRIIRSHPLVTQRGFIGLFILSLLFVPAASQASSIIGDSNTYVQSRQAADNTHILGAYEYLDFLGQNEKNEDVTFNMGGWLRYDINGNEFNKRSDSDLQYGYLSYKGKTGNMIANVGRVMVIEGVAAERLDGVYARTDLVGNFGIAAYGGSPVEYGLNLPGNNVIYGTRLTHQIADLYRIGISFLKEEKDSQDFRKEEGIDLWVRPVDKVEIMGNSKYNADTKDWASHYYYLVLGPFANVRLNTEASQINYKDYFTGSSTSAFSFQPGILDPNEKARILGEEVAYDVSDKMSLSANYKAYTYTIAGHAQYFGGDVKYRMTELSGTGFSIHNMDGNTDALRYVEYRAYGYTKFGKTGIILDVMDVAYAAPINNVKDAYTVAVIASYDMTEKLKIGADVEYSKNPDFDEDIRTFFRLTYKFDTSPEKRKEGM